MSDLRYLDLASASEISDAHRHCAKVAKQAAGNFYYAFLVLPRHQREGIQALYTFCRAGDDAADDQAESTLERADALKRVRVQLDHCYKGLYSTPMTLALADANRRFGFEREHFDQLLQGVETDLGDGVFETQADLELYCYRVASTVGLQCLKIFDADTHEARSYAVELGLGMQLTNILRDVWEDWERGRIYFPREEMKRYSLTHSTLFDPDSKDRLIELIQSVASRARRHFQNASECMPEEHRDRLIAARIMGRIYKTILSRIESNPGERARVELTRREKLTIAREMLAELNS
jgi:phytoene synthase